MILFMMHNYVFFGIYMKYDTKLPGCFSESHFVSFLWRAFLSTKWEKSTQITKGKKHCSRPAFD